MINEAITLFVALFVLAQLWWWSIGLWKNRPSVWNNKARIERDGWWPLYTKRLKKLSPKKNVIYTTAFALGLTGFYIIARIFLGIV